MLLFLEPDAGEDRRGELFAALRRADLRAEPVGDDPSGVVLRLFGPVRSEEWLESLPAVARALPASRPFHRVVARPGDPRTVVRVGERAIGDSELTVIAGPCAVEPEIDLVALARRLKRCGAHLLRGGAYKPRSSPYDFQGLGPEGLARLAEAGREAGLPVVTEAVDERSLDEVERRAQMVQIGARNMQNYALLKRAGESPLPVLLKRGLAASLEDFLLAAEYLLDRGNRNVVLCERGIRTFSDHSRFTLDLSILPRLREISHLPVVVDPSHASGRRSSVAALAKAAVAAGADGVMVEVHPRPERALCDGSQSIEPDAFEALAVQLRALASVRDAQGEVVP